MQNFANLQELYSYLEENALNLKDLQVADLFKNLKDLKFRENKVEEAKRARLEQMLFDFNVMYSKNALFSNENNEIINIFDLIEPDEYDYLEQRLNDTKNPLLQSHYAQILWFSPKSKYRHGIKLVDSNFELFKKYKEELMENKDDKYSLKTFNSLKNAYSMSYQLNYNKKDFIKSEILAIIKKHNFFNDSKMGIFIIRWIWKERKNKFKNEDFNDIDLVCWNLAKKLANEGDIHSSIEILEYGVKIEQKLQTRNFEWNKEIASSYEMLVGEYEKDNNSLMILKYYPLAIDKYKVINNFEKVKELEKKYTEIKKIIKFPKLSIPIDMGELIRIIEEKVDNVLKYEPYELVLFLMTSKNLFPKYSELNIIIEKNAEETPILSECSKIIIDQSGHPTKYFQTEEENKSFNLIFEYIKHLELYYKPLITKIFLNSILKNKLSAEILINHLKNNSWIGNDLEIPLEDNKIKYNWLAGIAPAIFDYFRQIEIYMVNPDYANFILCIDSLVVKIEGIIRDICKFGGIITSKNDRNDKKIKKEKDINELLHEDKLKELLGDDDILFLKILLTERSGYNLRNKIAHSLIESNDYDIHNVHMLLLAILRLSKFDLKDKNVN